jgi:hypothetical protein
MHKDTQLVCFIIILVLVAISWKGAQAAKFQHDDDDSFPNDDIIDKRGILVHLQGAFNSQYNMQMAYKTNAIFE